MPRRATGRAAVRAVAAGLLMTIAFPAAGQPPGAEGMVAVRRAGETGEGARLLGFVADAAGHVVAQIVADPVVGADFVVRLVESGADVAAQGVAYDAASGLGLLRVTADPPPEPYAFARDPAEPGRVVYGVALDADALPFVRRGASAASSRPPPPTRPTRPPFGTTRWPGCGGTALRCSTTAARWWA